MHQGLLGRLHRLRELRAVTEKLQVNSQAVQAVTKGRQMSAEDHSGAPSFANLYHFLAKTWRKDNQEEGGALRRLGTERIKFVSRYTSSPFTDLGDHVRGIFGVMFSIASVCCCMKQTIDIW